MADDQLASVKKRFELVEVGGEVPELVEEKSEINDAVAELVDNYSRELVQERRAYTPMHVDEIASKLSVLYEKIRKVIDWKDDNALRRGATERILKRVLFPKLTGLSAIEIAPDELAETVAVELIRGGHLPNDAVPRERVEKAGESLKKYLNFLQKVTDNNGLDVKKKVNSATFVIEIAACELEEILTHPMKEYGVMKAMTDLIDDRLKLVPADVMSPEEKKKHVFIAVCKTLYDLDENFIIYRLLKNKYTHFRHPNEEETKELGENLFSDWRQLKAEIEQPLAQKFTAVAERVDTVFILLDDILEKLKETPLKIRETLEYKNRYTELMTEAYEKRYKTLKTRLFRLGAFSTLSVFLSNWVTFYLVEVPLANVFAEGFTVTAAIVDFAIPTIVMFLLVSIIRAPRKENLGNVINASLGFIYPDQGAEGFRIRLGERPSIFRLVLGLMYVVSIGLVFWGIAQIFYMAKLPFSSVIFDTFTIALTVYAAHTIKNKSRELNVDEQMSGLDFLLDVITLPIARVGSVLAAKWKEYNIVAILFNFLVETPFVVVLNFVQEWSEFLKERRAELH